VREPGRAELEGIVGSGKFHRSAEGTAVRFDILGLG
jgi:hypothetical protein